MHYLEDFSKDYPDPFLSLGIYLLFPVDLARDVYSEAENNEKGFKFYKFLAGEKFFYVKPSNIWMLDEVA